MAWRRFIRVVSRTRALPSAVDEGVADRRRSPRLALYAFCSVYDHIRFHTRPRCKLTNVGLHGIGLEAPFLTGKGEELTLSFSVGGERISDAKAYVVWTRPNANGSFSGLQFIDTKLGARIKKALLRQVKSLHP